MLKGLKYCFKLPQRRLFTTILINNRIINSISFQMLRNISITSRIEAPKSNKGGNNKKKNNNEDVEVELPSTSEMTKLMEARITYLKEEFSKIRGGQATPEMFNHIKVNGYGSPMTLAQAGQISIKGGNKLVVNVYDPALLQFVTNAIRDCGMSLTPAVEGGAVVVSIPKSSAESRAEMSKLAAKASEKVKQEIRHIRKTTLDEVKALKGSISEDDTKRISKEIDTITEKEVEKVTKLLKDKEKDIMSS